MSLEAALADVRYRRQDHLIGQFHTIDIDALNDPPQALLTELGLAPQWSVCPPIGGGDMGTVASGMEADVYFRGPPARWGEADRVRASTLRELRFLDREGDVIDPYYMNQLTADIPADAAFLAVSFVALIKPEDAAKRAFERLIRWTLDAETIALEIRDACLANTPMIWAGRFPRW